MLILLDRECRIGVIMESHTRSPLCAVHHAGTGRLPSWPARRDPGWTRAVGD